MKKLKVTLSLLILSSFLNSFLAWKNYQLTKNSEFFKKEMRPLCKPSEDGQKSHPEVQETYGWVVCSAWQRLN